jgi:hypothetical protein
MRPLPTLLLIAVCTLAAAAAPAGAAAAGAVPGVVVASPTFVPAAGPLLAGEDGVVWVRRRDDAVVDLWAADAAGGARRVQRFVAADGARLASLRLSASPTAVGLELVEISGRRGRERVQARRYAGAFGQPLVQAPPAALPAAAVRFTDATATRAVWVARGCRSAQIRVVALPLPAPVRQLEPTCRLRLRAAVAGDPPVRLRAGRLRLGISCAGFELDCRARVVVRAFGRVIARGVASYDHATPPYAAASLRVTAVGRRLLRRHRRVRLRISARIDGAPARRTTRTIAGSPARR